MAKKAGKPRRGPSSSTTSLDLSTFDENALSALTARIDNGLSKASKVHDGGKKTMGNLEESGGGEANTRGVKRDAKGRVKLNHNKKEAGAKLTPSGEGIEHDRAALLEEILALGGTAEDLDLVNDVLSDDEAIYETSDQADNSLKKDLAQFIKGLDILQPDVDAQELETEDEQVDQGAADLEDTESDVARHEHVKVGNVKVQQSATEDINHSHLKDGNRLIFPAQPDWHAVTLPTLPTPEVDEASRYQEAIKNLKIYAQSLLESDSDLYKSKHLSSSSSHKFLSTIMTSGTLSDKVSALTLVVQESPVHTTKSFESLLGLAKKRSRGQAVEALGAIKDLLAMGVVLPTSRRLRTFATQPGLIATFQNGSTLTWKSGQPLPGDITKAHLISWAFEDWLKEAYFDMLKVLEGWCNDEVEYARSRAVTYVYELLKEKPEQEANLLRLLVNKLGDPDKKIASRTSYLLLQLQISHPLMKPIIVTSIEDELLLRPGQSLHAKYYAVNTLNQTILSIKEEDVAKRLLDIYFALFVTLLKKPEPELKPKDAPVLNRKGQVQGGGGAIGRKAKAKAAQEAEAKLTGVETTEKMISAVLTGVNRAFPFSKSDDSKLDKHMDTLFRITHSSNFNTSIQALMLIEQLATSKHLAVDRFYRTLYESLLDPRLVTSSKHALYLNLLFRALRADINIKRVKAFVKRLIQIVHLHQPPFICGVLYLLRELESNLPGLRTLFTEPEDHGDDEPGSFDELNETEDATNDISTTAVLPVSGTYDGRKRDPEYSFAEKSCLWESIPFLQHFHPSVSLFADRVLSNDKMPPKPDLTSHNLTSFLDRFVYRNVKSASTGSKGSSIMQPLSGSDNKGALLSNKTSAKQHGPLNTEAFWRKKAEDVAVDEVFFHRYFNQVGKSKNARSKRTTSDSTLPSIGDGQEDEDEDEIWQALVDSRPEVEGPSDDESDMDMLDLDDSGDSSAGWSDADSEVDVEGDSDLADLVEHEDDASDAHDDNDEDSGDENEESLDRLFAKEVEPQTGTDKKATGDETSRQRKKRLKSLPTFASAEDYAEMLDNDEDEDM